MSKEDPEGPLSSRAEPVNPGRLLTLGLVSLGWFCYTGVTGNNEGFLAVVSVAGAGFWVAGGAMARRGPGS